MAVMMMRTCALGAAFKSASRPSLTQCQFIIGSRNAVIVRRLAQQAKQNVHPVDKIRNIGIVAHIDAGKTTTTERMLYYVGYTKRIGDYSLKMPPLTENRLGPSADVDQGNTVTDFLSAERERGITINSACIPLAWRSHRLNLIDTPGHVDFTIEVERSMRVLDGAVCIFDGVAGVEAQTETVWNQANRYGVPRVAFINKMDREGAAVGRTVKAMEKRLSGWGRPILCQWPVVKDGTSNVYGPGSGGPGIEGVVDLLTMDILHWGKVKPETGSVYDRVPLKESAANDIETKRLLREAVAARTALVETLAEIDDRIVDIFLDHDGNHMAVPADEIRQALRRVTLTGKGVPVYCGAAFKNMGVQPVLDAIVDYLPSPADRTPPTATLPDGKTIVCRLNDPQMCALAFKVTHDQKRGPLVFVRVYSGRLERGATLYNPEQGSKERATKILQMYADDYEEINDISPGNIAAVVGLKTTRTGDTLTLARDKRYPRLAPIPVPPPVFMRSCAPTSASDEKPLAEALKALIREDPSVHVRLDEETGQTILSGMGELHLEIVADRLKEVHRVNCKLGKVQISYRESLATMNTGEVFTHHYLYDRETLGKEMKAGVTLQLSLRTDFTETEDQLVDVKGPLGGNDFKMDVNTGPDGSSSAFQAPAKFAASAEYESAVRAGIEGALTYGPLLGFPLTNLSITCTGIELYSPDVSTPSAVRVATQKCLQEALKALGGTRLFEPIMEVTVRVPERYVGAVSKDLSSTRRANIVTLDGNPDDSEDDSDYRYRTIQAHASLAQLIGYASSLRSLTAGTGQFAMDLKGYGMMHSDKQSEVMQELRGY
ncbi:P-loop containing nucleoside triphosphate hydrolase protein [Gaertneriomyces semiglobifer]|nr:P-loop containing nucleoside triphosphate hydrolase protein [Gaertneriomyces semiglobifer]